MQMLLHPDPCSHCFFVAVVLAPFFVHLELLFKAGYKPQLHKEINNSIGMEIARIRKAEGDKVRASKEL